MSSVTLRGKGERRKEKLESEWRTNHIGMGLEALKATWRFDQQHTLNQGDSF